MLIKAFSGINNVLPSHRLGDGALVTCENIDIGLSGELRRRSGYSTVVATCHKNLWQADGFMLATVDGNDLQSIAPNGAHVTVAQAVGTARVWYCNLPDGRVAYSNGSLCGLATISSSTKWGVPKPASIGSAADVAGSLQAGEYRYAITHVRTSDGLEGAPRHSAPLTLSSGGIDLTGLPTLASHTTNVYLTSHNGVRLYLAGNTSGSAFTFTGGNDELIAPCRTEFLAPAPAGRCLAFWRGRALVAVGPVLYASMAGRWEHFDMRRDFKQLSADITMVQPVDGGIFVGTTAELAFLQGTQFDALTYERKITGAVVLGSGVTVPGDLIKIGYGTGSGQACMCIADRHIVAGLKDGSVVRLTEGRYQTSATEVAATFRRVDDIPQYIAIPQ